MPVDPDRILDRDAALTTLLSGEKDITTYVVQRGDTLSGIARSYNISTDNLRNANPNLRSDRIQVGQVLNLQASSAMLHVRSLEEIEVTEVISRPVEYQENPDMTIRADKTLQAGSDGRRKVTYQLELINGVEVRRKQIKSNVTVQPVTKIIMPGIGYWPNSPTGIFRFPLNSGRITSKFGVSRPSGIHRGVDISSPRGTPIRAAAGGTVRTRTYGSSYGYYVSIDHGSGYSTLYAHMSSIASSVKVGGKVVRGQVIGYVGSTGFSTGSHLHWEVKRNGQLMNPLNFFE